MSENLIEEMEKEFFSVADARKITKTFFATYPPRFDPGSLTDEDFFLSWL